jgi:biotin carboxyl carrier protein
VQAPSAGKVHALRAETGAIVTPGQLLLVLQPS